MTCDDCRTLIDDYVDGLAADGDRAFVEAHLAECERCRTMAADFAEIRRVAGTLERHTPPPKVFARITAAIAADRKRREQGWQLRSVAGWRPLAIAATLVVLAGGSAWVVMRQPPAPSPIAARPAPTAPDTELAESVEMELKLAEEHYQRAIAGLEQITQAGSSTLDPQVAAVLQKNLQVIDHAIGESRAALQTQPTSEVAQTSLFEALRNKVALLQDTVLLINEMRQGNPEGTARAISGLNQ